MSGQTFSSNHHKRGNSHQKPPYFVFQITTFFCHIPGSPFLQKGSCGGSAALQILPLITIVLDHKVIHTFPQMYIQHLVQLKLVVPYPWTMHGFPKFDVMDTCQSQTEIAYFGKLFSSFTKADQLLKPRNRMSDYYCSHAAGLLKFGQNIADDFTLKQILNLMTASILTPSAVLLFMSCQQLRWLRLCMITTSVQFYLSIPISKTLSHFGGEKTKLRSSLLFEYEPFQHFLCVLY